MTEQPPNGTPGEQPNVPGQQPPPPPGYGQVPPPPPPPGYGQPAYGQAPQPGYGQPAYGGMPGVEQKSKIVAGILGILVGGLGIHRFYLGYTTIGVVQIIVTILTCGIGAIWGLIEGILILVGSTITTDAKGVPLKDG
jgi:TM2 domain-containing membrane protein YozV